MWSPGNQQEKKNLKDWLLYSFIGTEQWHFKGHFLIDQFLCKKQDDGQYENISMSNYKFSLLNSPTLA